MSEFLINGAMLRNMIISGANLLADKKAEVDALNVFPVPDGDTGTNMHLTILAAAKESNKSDSDRVCDIIKAAATGSLRGARGNSGVIVSQLFRGFAKALEGKDTINCADIAAGFIKASETAYKAVMKPKEGTILTVARVLSERAAEVAQTTQNFDVFAAAVMEAGYDILKKTTDMLRELREAGVVDAGGMGLLIFLEGAVNGMRYKGDMLLTETPKNENAAVGFAGVKTSDIKYAYCTEFFINLSDKDMCGVCENELKVYLETLGDSIVVVGDEDIIKIHVHTNNPGLTLEKAMEFGFLSNLKIENMKMQHTNLVAEKTPSRTDATKEIGIVSVAAGDGLSNLFKGLGADVIIEGGQTMNPSTEEFLEAVENVCAKNIIVLPNNRNIILAAEQAAKLTKDKKVYVIPTRTVPEGVTAIINYVSSNPIDEMVESMTASIDNVKTGEVTFAVRNTTQNGKKIKKGDIIGMTGNKVEVVSDSVSETAYNLLETMVSGWDVGIVTIYFGKDVSPEDADSLKNRFVSAYPSIDTDVEYGGQPLYYYIFSVE